MAIMANRLYKDTVFRDLFGSEERKENALSLYNALAGTRYGDPDELQLTTLDDVIYMSVKNDVSFLVGEEMVLWEHQSTKNPNMPLRGLVYFGRLYSSIADRFGPRLYGTELLPLPTPRYVVLYNGLQATPVTTELRLSDAYPGEGDIEVIAHVVNVNAGSGAEALDGCEELSDYAELVARVRKNAESMSFSEAVDAAVASCIEDGILAEYLRKRRAEVKDMFMTEFDEEEYRAWLKEEAMKEGREEGREENLLANLRSLMKSTGWSVEEAMNALDVPEADRERCLQKLR